MSKSQGISFERELRSEIYPRGYVITRVAASGGTDNPEPDVIVGGHRHNYAVEAKSTSKDKKYFGKDEVKQLRFYAANHSNCTPLLGVRFKGDTTWYFAHPSEVRQTSKSFVMEESEKASYKTVDDVFPEQNHVEVKDL